MGESLGIRRNWPIVSLMIAALVWMTLDQAGFGRLLGFLLPDETTLLYERETLATLMGQHLVLAGVSGALALVIGVALGLMLITPAGASFRDLVVSIANFGQTFPSIAVMALLVPIMGYGWKPVVVALVIYSVLPVMLNVVAGIENVPPAMVDAAQGTGMNARQRFLAVQLPLAMPIILGGVKNMLVIAVGAATLGAIVGAGGLGVPIMAGANQFKPALVLEGAIPSAFLALIIDRTL
ncbi:MAG: ABC transporter [Actinobacteria bacterium HGW-Actinobacteria-7]|jgi:osmoprotectant transport system permease protein|nr:MAG: ABC transporter [Actinobacteria bacterium HGW-Actinobacteria-7]